LKRNFKRAQTEIKKLKKQITTLNSELEAADSEINAQREELSRAAERLERDRNRHRDERDEIEDEHEEEIDAQKEHYELQLKNLKEHYEQQVADLEERLKHNEHMRQQEGGDWTKELEEALQRERVQLTKLNEAKDENAALNSRISELEKQISLQQTRNDSLSQNAETASSREREAEDKLDAALSLHARQMSHKQQREAELERTVAELGAALVVARQRGGGEKKAQSPAKNNDTLSWKERFEITDEELETVKAQLTLEQQRTLTLQEELEEIAKERTEETIETQTQQRNYDRQISDLTSTVSRLQTSLQDMKKKSSGADDESLVADLQRRDQEAQAQIVSLSARVLRQQTRLDTFTSEVATLKSRLQSANSRAEEAEQAMLHSPTTIMGRNVHDLESGLIGPSPARRRKKKGRNRSSIRNVLNLGPGQGYDEVGQTLDAIDHFAVETGSLLATNPFARMVFLMYFGLLHVWTFTLVFFHSIEQEHGDFGGAADMKDTKVD